MSLSERIAKVKADHYVPRHRADVSGSEEPQLQRVTIMIRSGYDNFPYAVVPFAKAIEEVSRLTKAGYTAWIEA